MAFPRAKIISPLTASKLLASPARVVPVDATWYMPNSPVAARAQFNREDRIPKSVFFDLDAVCCPVSKYPHMLPPHRLFDSSVGTLGINKSDSVLVYDRQGVFSGPRAAWTFSLFGHENVFLLDHYAQFRNEFEVEKGLSAYLSTPTEYNGIDNEQFLKNYLAEVIEFDELVDLVENEGLKSDYVLFDARSNDRFSGKSPEPRPGLSSGHVPGALSLPFTEVLDANGHYKPKEELLALFKEKFGLDFNAPFDKKGVIVMCGTGVTAVILRLALERVAEDIPIRVYDGSWTEWAQRAPHLIQKDV